MLLVQLRGLLIYRHFLSFLLLARYVPNVAKRSIWDQCKNVRSIYWEPTDRPSRDRPTDDRPTSHLAHIGEISNGHISARGRPIHFMFGSAGVFGVGGSNGAICGFAKSKMAAESRHLGKFKWRYLCGGSSGQCFGTVIVFIVHKWCCRFVSGAVRVKLYADDIKIYLEMMMLISTNYRVVLIDCLFGPIRGNWFSSW